MSLPKDGETAANGPGHQACFVLRVGGHSLMAVGTHRLSRDAL